MTLGRMELFHSRVAKVHDDEVGWTKGFFRIRRSEDQTSSNAFRPPGAVSAMEPVGTAFFWGHFLPIWKNSDRHRLLPVLGDGSRNGRDAHEPGHPSRHVSLRRTPTTLIIFARQCGFRQHYPIVIPSAAYCSETARALRKLRHQLDLVDRSIRTLEELASFCRETAENK